MVSLEIEGAERGWLASVGLDAAGEPSVQQAASPEVASEVARLIRRLLEEPLDGQIIGARRGEALLHALADACGRRRPLLGAERVFGYVQGGHRMTPTPPLPPGWDDP